MPKIFNRAAFEVSNSDAARFCKLCFQPRSVGRFFESVCSRPHISRCGGISAQLSFRHDDAVRTQSGTLIKGVVELSCMVITFECNGWELRTAVKTVKHRIDCSRNDGRGF